MSKKRRGSKRKRKKKTVDTEETLILFEEASVYKRIYAYCIDLLIFGLPYLLISFTLLKHTLHIVELHTLIITIGMTVYFLFFSLINRGKTLGQMIFNIKVVLKEDLDSDIINKDLYKIPIKNSILHNLGKSLFFITVDVTLYEFFKKIHADPAIHRIGQRIAKTAVVIRKKT